jgi:2-oxoglutarate ferredoxin oxidoreductase subunit beta
MDNGVYGLTKGQSSPTTKQGEVTSSTPYGKLEAEADPLELYLTLGVSFIASGFSGQPRQLAKLIAQGINHKGFAMVHVQSPCTTYNDTYEMLKGNPKQGIEPFIWEVPEHHNPADKAAAYNLLQKRGLPIGVIYEDKSRPSLGDRLEEIQAKARQRTVQELVDSYAF